jgi:hypothetical protein
MAGACDVRDFLCLNPYSYTTRILLVFGWPPATKACLTTGIRTNHLPVWGCLSYYGLYFEEEFDKTVNVELPSIKVWLTISNRIIGI